MIEHRQARPSSTVVLARDVDDDAEIFMVKRHASSSFGAAFAFPGGVVDTTDADVYECCDGRDPDQADRSIGVESGGLDYYVAAIRELYEETGILLATVEKRTTGSSNARDLLNRNLLTWTNFIHESGGRMLCDQLHYFSHWITPEDMPKRYSTRFFIAELPAGQVASHDGRELTDSQWITASNALAAGDDKKIKLHYPTRKILQSLADHRSVSEMIKWAAGCQAAGVETVQPVRPEDRR